MTLPQHTTASCPEPEQLKQLLDGALSAAEQAALSAHVEACETCQRMLESLAAGRETWQGAARHLQESGHEPAPGLKQVIDELRDTPQTAETHIGESSAAELPPGFFGPPDEPGHLGKLDHYEVLEVVGRGAFGTVLRAFDQKLHRVVAIKVMSPQLASSGTARKRFIREGRAAAAICHEHVVTIHAVEESGPLPYLVMQFVQGVSLQERLDRKGPPALNEILRIGMQAAAGLAAAHEQGLVHRDIKPSNILLENGVERVKISDFGLARAADDASLTQTGVIAGTPQYMAPEQARGDAVDHRADLFSLGSVLYTLCAGRPPFRASTTLAVLKRVCEEAPRPIREINPEIPAWLAAIIGKLHAKDPAERFQSAHEVSELLGRCLAHVQQPGQFPLPQVIEAPHAGSSTPNQADSPHPVRSAAAQPGTLPAQPANSWINRPVGPIPVVGALLLILGIAPVIHLLRATGLVSSSTAEGAIIASWTAAWMAQLLVVFVAILQRIRHGSWTRTVLGSRILFVLIALIGLDLAVGSRVILPALTSVSGAGARSRPEGGSPVAPVSVPSMMSAQPPASARGGRLVIEADPRMRIEIRDTTDVLRGPDDLPIDVRPPFDQQLPVGTYELAAFAEGDERPWLRTRLKIRAGETRRLAVPRPESDEGRLQGRWIVVSQEGSGTQMPADFWTGSRFEFAADQMRQISPVGEPAEGRFVLDPRRDPKQIDYFDDNGRPLLQGIYRLERDSLTMCLGPMALGKAALVRPDEFRTRMGSETQLYICRRAQTSTAALQGRWKVVSQDHNGQSSELGGAAWWEFNGDRLSQSAIDELGSPVEVENGSDPKQIDLFTLSGTQYGAGIYKIDDGRLIVCMGSPGQRPTVFPARAPPGQVVTMLSRPAPESVREADAAPHEDSER